MNDHPDKAPAETPMERALRLKQAAIRSRPKRPGEGDIKREQAAGVAAGASKPWMKKR